jgi:hypothetical protein
MKNSKKVCTPQQVYSPSEQAGLKIFRNHYEFDCFFDKLVILKITLWSTTYTHLE